jgi:hypothetical protein
MCTPTSSFFLLLFRVRLSIINLANMPLALIYRCRSRQTFRPPRRLPPPPPIPPRRSIVGCPPRTASRVVQTSVRRCRRGGHGQYNASPLQRALTPPPPDGLGPNDPEPFPSVESLDSGGSGQNFHISGSGLPTSASSNENTSPLQYHSHPYQHSHSSSFGSKSEVLEIYCASCGRPWLLKNAFACTECICGVCSDCVGQIISSPVVTVQPGIAPMRRGCPRCGVMGGRWKKFAISFVDR